MAQITTSRVDSLREGFPEAAKDMKLNLSSVLNSENLTPGQTWGVALASAYFVGDKQLTEALLADARESGVSDEVIEDARAAATIMGMNTIYYRFRHLVGKESYSKKQARLRMNWMSKPKTDKGTFELFSLAVAALAGCEMCIKSHEANLIKEGLSEEQVHDTVRIASVIQGSAVALRLADS